MYQASLQNYLYSIVDKNPILIKIWRAIFWLILKAICNLASQPYFVYFLKPTYYSKSNSISASSSKLSLTSSTQNVSLLLWPGNPHYLQYLGTSHLLPRAICMLPTGSAGRCLGCHCLFLCTSSGANSRKDILSEQIREAVTAHSLALLRGPSSSQRSRIPAVESTCVIRILLRR